MIASRAEPGLPGGAASRRAARGTLRLLAALLLVAPPLLSDPVAAQPLILKRAQPDVSRDAPQMPAATPGETTSGSETVPLRPLDNSAIVVNALKAVNFEAVGVIGPAEGGFETSLWQGGGWALVGALMPRTPEMSVSPVIQSLTSRLLLSRGGVPEGKPDDVSFVRLRVERLLAMGDVGNALGLIDVIPAERRDESLARVETDALFLDGRRAEACGKVEVSVARYQDIYWRQAQAFCLALAGAHARAALIADLLRERSVDVSPVFFAAIERLGGGRNVDAKPPPAPDGLGLSMMLAAGMPPPASFLKTARPAALRSIALSSGAEPALRLEAAERAQAVGALTEDEVMRLFLGFPFTEEEVANPLTAAESAWGPRARALLIRAAASQPVSLGKADVLRSAWQLGTERGGHDEVRRASVSVVAGMPVDSTLSEFAGAASRMLFAAGRLDEALAWYRVVAADAARSPETQRAAESLWPLALLAGDGEFGGRATGGLQGWYDDLRQRDPQHAQRKALALFSVLEASGRDVPATLWQSLLGAPMVSLAPALNMAWAESLDDASRNRRVGEVVLLVVSGAAAVGDRTFPSDSESVRAIRALREVGLEADARRLAVETAIAAGI